LVAECKEKDLEEENTYDTETDETTERDRGRRLMKNLICK